MSDQAVHPALRVRRWLRVPEGLGVPGWATRRLDALLRGESAAREGRALENVVFGVVDLETTGLSAQQSRILEVGLVVIRAGRILECFDSLVAVDAALPPIIRALTGIGEAELVDAPHEPEALDRFARVLERHRVEALVGHNARFDRSFLAQAWRRHDGLPQLPPFLCSLRLARAWVEAPSHGLDRLVAQLGIPRAARHRALGDAQMTAWLWHELLRRGRLRGVRTLETLRVHAELPVRVRASRTRRTIREGAQD